MRASLAGAVALLVMPACARRSAADRGDMSAAAQLQGVLDTAVSRGLPGISAAIATHSGIVWTGVAGKADLQSGAPIRADMLFGMGSITKTFAAVVILQLVQEGKLKLDAT